jgi:hypothetical protein
MRRSVLRFWPSPELAREWTVIMAASSVSRHERRNVLNRPHNGDEKPCSGCGGTSEFNEKYRFEGSAVPAWVCERPTCRPETVRAARVSAAEESRQLRRNAKHVQAKARRTVMKAKAAVARSEKRLADSEARIRGKR